VTHTCNLSHLGGRDLEDCDLRPAQAKKLMRPSISTNKLGVVVPVCGLSYAGRKIRVQNTLVIKVRTYLNNNNNNNNNSNNINLEQKGLGCDSYGRASA
jgi:hypothetical protein